ncbi:MAG: nitrogen regulation protein NR(I) [Gammaproteobacteria bacterium]|nr:nitrogen regulation protein NR(I) [Gammaproteobacteria bacterium]
MPRPLIWIIDDDDSIRWVLDRALQQADLNTEIFESANGIMDRLQKKPEPDALLVDIRMPGLNGLELLGQLTETRPDLPVIIMTAHSDLNSAIAAHEGGAFDYLPKPFDIDEAVSLVERAIRQKRETRAPNAQGDAGKAPPATIIGQAPAMQQVFRAIGRLAQSDLTVLITGESGTGKELIAHALHEHNPRHQGPFIAINTAAIPKELLESELFGHERGAFTGAQMQRQGRFEQAKGGTLFLDEIGDMPFDLQTRLLRVLANGQFYRVGGQTAIRTDVRIIAATHQDLWQLVEEGRFREDLYHRLNVIRIHSPALRERMEDIPALTEHFLQQAAKELGLDKKTLDPESARHFQNFPWPGNVRQLENICRWLTVMVPGREVQLSDIPDEIRSPVRTAKTDDHDWRQALSAQIEACLNHQDTSLTEEIIPEVERLMIEGALARTHGRRQEAAKLLGWGRNTLTRKIKELGIEEMTDTTAG